MFRSKSKNHIESQQIIIPFSTFTAIDATTMSDIMIGTPSFPNTPSFASHIPQTNPSYDDAPHDLDKPSLVLLEPLATKEPTTILQLLVTHLIDFGPTELHWIIRTG